jgi:hypothetical protein
METNNPELKVMRKILCLCLTLPPILLSSCATPAPPQTFRNTDGSAVIVDSLDARSCRVLLPTPTEPEDNARFLDQARGFTSHQTVVIILENYAEPQLGREFRERTFGWFIGLRGLGYQHIVFLKGNGATEVNGMETLADYD